MEREKEHMLSWFILVSSLTWGKHHWCFLSEKNKIIGAFFWKKKLIGAGIYIIKWMNCYHDVLHLLLWFWACFHLIGTELFIRWWRFGIEHLKFFLVRGIILHQLMCGQLVAFLLKWWTRSLFFLGILRLMSCIGFSGLIYKVLVKLSLVSCMFWKKYLTWVALFCQCSILGTPNEETWPAVASLLDYRSTFPKWPSVVSHERVPFIIANGGGWAWKVILCSAP